MNGGVFLGFYANFTTPGKPIAKATFFFQMVIPHLIREGKRIMAGKPLDICPVCEQPIEGEAVLDTIEDEEQNLSELQKAANELDSKEVKHFALFIVSNPWLNCRKGSGYPGWTFKDPLSNSNEFLIPSNIK